MKLLLKTKLQKVDQGFFERDFVNYSVNFRTNILAQTSPSNENMIGLKNLSTRNVIRKLYDVKRSHSGSRINLSSVGGKDTDPNHTYEIL